MEILAGFSKPSIKASPVPRRSPPPPPSSTEPTRNPSPISRAGGSLGAFWSSQHAKDTAPLEDNSGPKFDEETSSHSTSKDRYRPGNHYYSQNASPPKEANTQPRGRRNAQGNSLKPEEVPSKDFEIRFFQEDSNHGTGKPKASKVESTTAASFQNDAFNTFVAEFDTSKLSSGSNANKSGREDELEAETERLKEQLKQANLEKSEITSKFEKLSAICRSQRQEIQELKQALAATTPSPPNIDAPKHQTSTGLHPYASPLVSSPPIISHILFHQSIHPSIHVPDWFFSHKQHGEKIEATVRELKQRKSDSPASSDSKPWQAFSDDPKPPPPPLSRDNTIKSVRTRNGQQHNKPSTESASRTETWGFGTESFTATPAAGSGFSRPTAIGGNNAHLFGEPKKIESKSAAAQPAGWAGF